MYLILLIVSIFANTLSAFVGGGAGLIQLPMLIFLNLPFPIALATHKCASVALGLGAGLRHLQERKLNPFLILMLLGFGLPGVWLGANVALLIPERFAHIGLSTLTIFLGIYSFTSSQLGIQNTQFVKNNFRLLIGGVVIFFIGVLNGSFSSGTGLLMTFWLVRWFRLSYTNAIAHTLIAVGFFWNGTGALAIGLNSEIKWDWIPILVAGSIFGGYLGAQIAIIKGSSVVKSLYEILCVLIGLMLLYRGLY